MKIQISNKQRPFSHTPGAFALLPGSTLRLQAFPTYLCVDDLSGHKPKNFQKLFFALQGPVKEFTVQQDLERGCLFVWGGYSQGYVRYKISAIAGQKGFAITLLRGPQEGVRIENLDKVIKLKETLFFPGSEGELYRPAAFEKLSLGMHKAQDADLVARRADLKEIFPLWFRLGNILPEQKISSYQGTLSLLADCEKGEKDKIVQNFLNLFHAAFEGILSPGLADAKYLGFNITPPDESFTGSPLALLTLGSKLIRSLFIAFENNALYILPDLPREFHAGRLINVEIPNVGSVDMEWSKKKIRRLIIRSKNSLELSLKFQKEKQYRLRENRKEKGSYLPTDKTIRMDENRTYFLDNFKN